MTLFIWKTFSRKWTTIISLISSFRLQSDKLPSLHLVEDNIACITLHCCLSFFTFKSIKSTTWKREWSYKNIICFWFTYTLTIHLYMYWVLIQCGSLSRIYLDLFSWWMLHVILEFNSPNGLFSPDLMKLCNIIYVPVTVAACITANYPHRMIRRTISPPSKYLKTNIGKYLVSGVRQCRVYMSRRFEGCRWWIEDAIAISYRDAVDQLLRFFSLNIVLRKVWQTGTFREIEDRK